MSYFGEHFWVRPAATSASFSFSVLLFWQRLPKGGRDFYGQGETGQLEVEFKHADKGALTSARNTNCNTEHQV